MKLFVAGWGQSAADQPKILAEGHPQSWPLLSSIFVLQFVSNYYSITIPIQEFTADLKHRMRGVWRDDAELVDPKTHDNKLATYHSWFATPFSRNERMPINVPRYLHLDLSEHIMRNISIFCLRTYTLKVEAAAWHEDGSCDQPNYLAEGHPPL